MKNTRRTLVAGVLVISSIVACEEEKLPPVDADFTASETIIQEGSSILFKDQSTGSPTHWNWNFEGGTPASSNESNPAITYYEEGVYAVTLIASNSDTKDTLSKTDYIRVFEPVDAYFEASAAEVYVGTPIEFTDESEGNPTRWEWIFEGGNPTTSTEQHPTVTYHSAGTYDVTLIASNTDISDTITNSISVFDEEKNPCPGTEDSGEIFTVVEDQSAPVGGMQAFYEFVAENLVYPEEAKELGIEGRVFVQFVVNCDGSITDVQAVKGIGGGCDEEAVRVISISPKWNPAKQRGKLVRVRMVLPITFQLG